MRPASSRDALALLDGAGTGHLRHVREFPAQAPLFSPWPDEINPQVAGAFTASGVKDLWQHQAEAISHVMSGRHVVISTGTASGKSLAYQAPMLSIVADGDPLFGSHVRSATAVYLSPTKALAEDQRTRLEKLHIPAARIATLDGDTPLDERRWIREHANIVLTNPDLLHHSMLPSHERWSQFWRALKIVVIDESHVYRGVFGAHTAGVIRRLRRIAQRYGATPTFILTSATNAEPARHAYDLTGLEVEAITHDSSPRPATTFALWEPGPPPGAEPDAPRRSAVAETGDLLTKLVMSDVQTLAFARSRGGVEVIADIARSRLDFLGYNPDLVAAYRGGYLPEERRELERGLREGQLKGLAATSALELGIDITGLDAVVLAGWPGTVASLRQQAGRAGRSGRDALALFVAADDPLDTYLVDHPEVFFDRPVETTVMDPTNPHVLAPQLACAAAELPLTKNDTALFSAAMWPLVDELTERKILRRRPTGWFWARDDRPGDHVSLRGSAGDEVRIVESRTGRVLGTVDGARALTSVHTGAVYVHQGRNYIITNLDLDDGSATATPGNPGWSTSARTVSHFDIVESHREKRWGQAQLHFGTIRVRSQVTSFLRRLPSGEVIGEHPLDLPEQSLITKGVWWTLPLDVLEDAQIGFDMAPGALHAAEHCSIGLISLVAQGDRWDVGGVSTAEHPDTAMPTVVVYDALPGGSGFAERAFEKAEFWLSSTLEAIQRCACDHGCPACIQSPKCGNGNHPLDKAGAIRLLQALLTDSPKTQQPADHGRSTAQ